MSLPEMMGRPESARIFLPSSTLVPSRRTTSGTLRPTCFAAATTPSAITSHFMMPPKMFTRIAFNFGLRQHDLERLGHLLGRGAAAHVEEVGGRAAVELDRVHRRHREARAVHEAADVAVELDVVQVELRGLDLRGILFVEVAQRHDVRMAEERVVVEVELRVERHDAPVAGDDERIDFDERAVALVEALVERLEELARLAHEVVGHADLARDVFGVGVGKAGRRDRWRRGGSSRACARRLPRCPCRLRSRPSAPPAACARSTTIAT